MDIAGLIGCRSHPCSQYTQLERRSTTTSISQTLSSYSGGIHPPPSPMVVEALAGLLLDLCAPVKRSNDVEDNHEDKTDYLKR